MKPKKRLASHTSNCGFASQANRYHDRAADNRGSYHDRATDKRGSEEMTDNEPHLLSARTGDPCWRRHETSTVLICPTDCFGAGTRVAADLAQTRQIEGLTRVCGAAPQADTTQETGDRRQTQRTDRATPVKSNHRRSSTVHRHSSKRKRAAPCSSACTCP